MKFLKRFILPFIISLSLFLTFTVTCFAFNDIIDYTTVKTITNSYLNGIPFFYSNTNFGTVSNYIYDILENNNNKYIHFIPVCYYNNKVYLPITKDYRNQDETYQYLLYNNGSKYTLNNSTYYGYSFVRLAGHGGGLSTVIGKNNRLYGNEYSNADFLYCNLNSDNSLTFDIRYPMSLNNGTFTYGTATTFTCKKFAYINDAGTIDYYEGYALGDNIFNTSNIYWCCIVRDYSGGIPSTTKFLDLPTLFNLFNEHPTGITTDDYGKDPTAIFPRYPSQATDNSGFYYDDLSSVPLSFYVKDFGNKHKYSLQIRSTHIKSDQSTYRTDFGVQLDLPSYTWINQELLDSILTNVQNLPYSKNILSRWSSNKLIFDNIMTINFPCLDFSRVDNGARVTSCTFNLSSFIKAEDTQFFTFYVIDDISGDCVGSCAVLTSKGFGYVPTSYPVNTYSWNIDSFESDLPTGSNFIGHNDYRGSTNGLCYTPTISSDGDALTGNSKYYDGSDFDYTDYNNNDFNFNVDISSLTNTFGTALDSTRQFFSLCIGLIPPAIIAFIFGTLALIVLLRILGR